tara:strand:+ start:200227 stop:203649 length:3423 start_codon:yes stop_codon:yes gene_type:complete
MIKKIGLSAKIQDSKNLKINGFSDWQWIFLNNHFISDKKKQVYVFEDSDRAEEFYSKFKKENNALFFPDLESQIFEGAYSSERDLFERFLCISKVIENKDHAVFTTYKALAMYIPTLESLKELTLNINVDDIISPFELSKKLISLGFEKNPTVEEPGTFSQKGEIFDIYPIDNEPFRIHYFDDLIEEIHEIDKNSLRTLKDKKLESYTILPSPKAFLNSNTVKNFLDKIPRIGPSQKNKQSTKENIIESINSNNLFQNFPLYFSLFLEESTSFYNFLNSFNYEFNIFNKELIKDSFELEFTHLLEVHEDNIENDNDEIIPDPNYIYKRDLVVEDYLSVNDIDLHNDTDITQSISLKPIPFKSHILSLSKIDHKNKKELFDYVGKYLQKKSIESNTILFVYQNKENVEKFKHYYENQQFLNKIIFLESSLEHGFIYESEKLIIVHESDLYTAKIKKTKSANFSEDVFADQLASLEEGDYVIHKSLGIGQYKGVETIEIGNQKGDFVVLHYEGEDKAYVPVYKLNLIQKHSSSEAHVKVANLNSKKFDLEKNKAKKSVKKLAFDLLELQAKREMKRGYQFSEPSDLFYEFIDKFKFKDTPDQASATEDVISDMCSHKPMDRLICGDVGFGKTEIAMRAAFKAVEDHKQVVILVPTTVLAFQHYNSFLRRFEDFPVNIEFLSRFKSPKESKDILQRLEQGKVDIIIGTHKLLSDKIKYHDLGLLVIDEEQRFGVSHKEKIKLFKENLDCLVLTATPIPRTLQMSFLGIKDLSLIKTAPPKRQSIKTYLIKEDANTLRNAINKELGRGGQIFVVHNKVKDIEDYTAKISRLNPDAKIIYAHGQLPERELEKRITDFYNHKYDILVATTIIESGIDIPSANTMIIDRADTYGLSQLHQLRGRIGRSDKKAYAYFTIPSQRNISQIAAKRLRALQTYADMGSGFSLATSDLEIRGSGDILGAEQSGHIANIGLELYMELLKETINELKNNKNEVSRNIEIQTPFNSYIDSKYIDNSGVRLKYYKKISGAKSLEKLDEIKNELSDIYGPIPEELNNLFTILAARNYFNKLPIDSIKVTSKQIHLNFNKKELDEKSQIRDKLIPIFLERPKVYNLKPNYSVICHFKERVSLESLLEFSKYIAMQIEPC